jgi:hypothetical protein
MVFLPLKTCHLRWPLQLGYKAWQERIRTCHYQSKHHHHHQVQTAVVNNVELGGILVLGHDTPDRKTLARVLRSPLKQKLVLLLDALGLDK